ncbi:MAG: potassium channel family protein [Candidatus Omnitrophota bacterium]
MKESGKLFYLLICLFFILFVYPFVEQSVLSGKILVFFFTLVLASATFAVSTYKRVNFVVALALAVPTSILIWADELLDNQVVEILSFSFMMVFSFFAVICIVSHIMSAKKVTRDILAGGVSAYLLIGISWGMLYALLECVHPGSFVINSALESGALDKWSTFNYYSFTTLTTLGYGDITALSIHAQSFAILEAVTGVLFIAVLISRLVGMYLYQIKEGNAVINEDKM